MTTMTAPRAATDRGVTSGLAGAATHLYDAECALSAARATGDDRWIAAAADKLHEAVIWYEGLRAGAAVR